MRNTLHSTYNKKKKNMRRVCFIIGGFSLRAMYLWVNGVYLVQRFSFVIADFSLKATSLYAELSVYAAAVSSRYQR